MDGHEPSVSFVHRVKINAAVSIGGRVASGEPGGVLTTGQEILELPPVEEGPLVGAYVQPVDIDVVQHGETAPLHLTALNQRVTPTVPGRVVYVSANTTEGKPQSEIFYASRIMIDEKEAA